MLRLVKIEEKNFKYPTYLPENKIICLWCNGGKWMLKTEGLNDIPVTDKCRKMLLKKFCKSLDFEKEKI